MDGVLSRRRLGNTVENPAYVVANFAPGSKDTPPLLTHDEVLTLFHEFGHAVHHLTTQVDIMDLAGINGALGRGGAAEPVLELVLDGSGAKRHQRPLKRTRPSRPSERIFWPPEP